jgi:AraC-like DNA-binding protein
MADGGAFRKRVQRLADGAFSSQIGLVDAGVLRFGIERLDGPIRVHGTLPDGLLHASVSWGTDLRLDGIRVDRPTLHVYGAGAAFDATTRGPMSSAMLVIGRDALCDAQDSDDPLGDWFHAAHARSLRPGPGGDRLAGLLATLAHRVTGDAESMLEAASGMLQHEMLGALREAVASEAPSPSDERRLGPASRRRLALAAEEMVLGADDGAPPSVESLCRALGTGERSLQLAFREQFGTSIRSFVQTARLQKAHSTMLRQGDRMSLTDIATQYGFWHLGRFARYYRETFGCTPSVTLRRVWGERVGSAAR